MIARLFTQAPERKDKNGGHIKTALHFALAFLLAGFILNGLLYGYYKRPPKIDVEAGTDKIWGKNSVIIDRTEGFGTVRTDSNGYNNTFVPSDADNYILLMGSSHTQAINVNQDQNYAYLLTERLREAGMNELVYNIGFDGNDFLAIIEHFGAAMEQFHDSDAVIVEIYKLDYSPDALRAALERRTSYDPSAGHSGLSVQTKALNFAQSLPLVRLAHSRISSLRLSIKNAFTVKQPRTANPAPLDTEAYRVAVFEIISEMKLQAGGKPLILLYNSLVRLNSSGELVPEPWDEQLSALTWACAENNVHFHDMTDTYIKLFTEKNTAAFGFINAKAAEGHLNPAGHRAVADDLLVVVANALTG